jgi:tetratricopeptide (TPR) repeat protein
MTMRNRLARACVVASLLTFVPASFVCLTPASAMAQGKKDKKDDAKKKDDKKKDDKKGGKPVEVDLDADKDKDAGKGKKGGDSGPVTAGQPTEEAATAKRLFDSEKWAEAALALSRVQKGETGDDEGNKQEAQYRLAVALYKLKFYQASYAIFSEIADKPNHLKFNETLLWLAELATTLPEPADIVERVGKYNDEQVGRFNNNTQKPLFWQLNFLLGRYKYRNRQYEEAIQLFEKVDKKSKFYVQAQFFNGISYVQLKKSVPAVQSFQRIVQAIDDGVEGVEDAQRMLDLSYLSMARTYYSASVKLDENNNPSIDEKKLSAAVKYWNRIDVGSEYWLDGLFEESWAYFMAGDYPRALGNIHTIQAPYFPNSFYPEADILKAQIYFATCQYDYATTAVAQFKKKYDPVQKELDTILKNFAAEGKEEEAFKFFKEVKGGKSNLPANVKPIVELALSDRALLRHLDYAKLLEEEEGRFQKAPGSFKDSPLGGDVRDALDLAKSIAVKNGGKEVRDRYQRNLDELNEHLRNGAKILIDITSAERNKLEQTVESGKFTQEDAKVFGVVNPDEEHVLWPFDGEYWRDELGFYRQVVVSKCGR